MSKWKNYPEQLPPYTWDGFKVYVRLHAEQSGHVRIVDPKPIPAIFFGRVCIADDDIGDFILDIAQWKKRNKNDPG